MNEKRMNQRSSADCRSTCIESPLNGDLAGGHESALFRLEGKNVAESVPSMFCREQLAAVPRIFFFFSFFCRGLKVGAREDAHRVECCSRRMRDLSADRSHVSRSRVLRALSAPYARPSTCPPFTRFPFHSFGEIGVDCGAFFWKFH